VAPEPDVESFLPYIDGPAANERRQDRQGRFPQHRGEPDLIERPPEAKATYDRLKGQGLTDTQALQLIGLALKKEMKQMIAESRGFDNERYVALMNKLPDID
jgi:hypothetical protein